ncbi:MAG TPA: hypothetical protein VNT75_12445, partial [Symbiobacteriaceae bacterium]|nr:hypothetical protein [Symbiobacteriaceae bacterium]
NVAGVREATREERQRWTGELGDLMVVTLREPLEILRPLVPPDGLGAATAERLAFHLWVQDGDGRLCAAKELGFTGRHPRFAGFLPDDETLFALPMGRGHLHDGEYPGQALWPQVKEPRFPLAAADQNAYVQTEDVWLPLGMGLAGPDLIAGAIHTGESPLERDGLEDWSPALLADPLLLESPVEVLESELLQRITEATTPLKGLHALWPVTEVTLVALPDAGHGGWAEAAAEPVLTAPELNGAHGVDNCWHLSWTPVGERLVYRLQWAADDDFRVDLREVTCGGLNQMIEPPPGGTREYFFRVRAERQGEPGPWSATLTAFLPKPDFAPIRPSELPGLRLEPDGGGIYRAVWPHAGADWYELQTSHTPDFAEPLTVYAGARPGEAVWHSGSGAAYFRLRARWGDWWGPWSATAVIPAASVPAHWQPATGSADAHRVTLLKLHKALLRLAAVRGDLFALLSLPERYLDSDVSAYARQLAAELRHTTGEKALSYGALYHPWVWVRDGRQRLLTPPDGPMAGQFAERARQKGVWFPAANQPLAGVEDVVDPVETDTQLILERERVNVLVKEGRGVSVMTSLTLSREPELRMITARRLLSQLRRILLLEGSYLVFEPNDDRLRAGALARCRRVLTDLFVQGAFAGETPDESFSVSVSPYFDGRQAADSGRFGLDIAVAPSRPLSFITVRLVQSDSGGLSIREG